MELCSTCFSYRFITDGVPTDLDDTSLCYDVVVVVLNQTDTDPPKGSIKTTISLDNYSLGVDFVLNGWYLEYGFISANYRKINLSSPHLDKHYLMKLEERFAYCTRWHGKYGNCNVTSSGTRLLSELNSNSSRLSKYGKYRKNIFI